MCKNSRFVPGFRYLPNSKLYFCSMIHDDEFLTIASPAEGFYRNRGSRFLAFASPVRDENEVKQKLTALKSRFPDATHHCFAWRLGADGNLFRYYDDGEPSGSAGRPIYGQILSKGLTNILVVVVRYYGGIKLGVPGLIEAYRMAAMDALSLSTIVTAVNLGRLAIRFDYQAMNNVMRVIKELKMNILESEMDNSCRLVVEHKQSGLSGLCETFRKISGVDAEIL